MRKFLIKEVIEKNADTLTVDEWYSTRWKDYIITEDELKKRIQAIWTNKWGGSKGNCISCLTAPAPQPEPEKCRLMKSNAWCECPHCETTACEWLGVEDSCQFDPAAPQPEPDEKDENIICGGCRVRGVWEHRCHGGNCQCKDCATPAPEPEKKYIDLDACAKRRYDEWVDEMPMPENSYSYAIGNWVKELRDWHRRDPRR